MRILIPLILFAFVFTACEKSYDTTLDPVSTQFKVTSIAKIDSVFFNPADSMILLTLGVQTDASDLLAFARVFNPSGETVKNTPVSLKDDGLRNESGDQTRGDGVFSGRLPMSSAYPTGDYMVEYYVELKKSGVQMFVFNNGQSNLPPVISDVTAPDSIVLLTEPRIFLMTVRAEDGNGKQDISSVNFVSYRPNGTTSGNAIPLYDNGSTENGDLFAGDGIYSVIVVLDPNNLAGGKGEYRFEFKAVDRSGAISNIINHIIKVL